MTATYEGVSPSSQLPPSTRVRLTIRKAGTLTEPTAIFTSLSAIAEQFYSGLGALNAGAYPVTRPIVTDGSATFTVDCKTTASDLGAVRAGDFESLVKRATGDDGELVRLSLPKSGESSADVAAAQDAATAQANQSEADSGVLGTLGDGLTSAYHKLQGIGVVFIGVLILVAAIIVVPRILPKKGD